MAEVFVRKTSGLRKEWSLRHAFYYNFLSAASLGGGFVLTASIFGSAFWGGGDPVVALVPATLGVIPIILSFALLSAAMPRAGGDYVWTSRTLHPALGFAFTQLNLTIFGAGWYVVNGFTLAWAYLNPAFYLLGSPGAAQWVGSPAGQTVVAFVFGVIAAIIISLGMRNVGRAIAICTVATAVATLLYIGIGLSYTPATFKAAYDGFIGSGAYQKVIDTARANGFAQIPFNWAGTLIFMTFLSGQLALTMFANPHLGEVKNAGNLRLTVLTFIGALLLSSIFMIGVFYVMFRMPGPEFFRSLNYLYAIGKGADVIPHFTPYFPYLAAMALGGGFGTLIVTLIMLVALTLQAGIYYQILNQFNGVKYLFSSAFDRILPSKVAYVHPRTGAPLVALIVIFVMATVWLVGAYLRPELLIFRAVTAFGIADLVYFGGVCIAAIVFPYKLKHIYNASPLPKYSVGRVPITVVAGVLGLGYVLLLLFLYAAQSAVWNLSIPAIALVTIMYVAVGSVYFISYGIRKRQGIPLSAAFKELPPE